MLIAKASGYRPICISGPPLSPLNESKCVNQTIHARHRLQMVLQKARSFSFRTRSIEEIPTCYSATVMVFRMHTALFKELNKALLALKKFKSPTARECVFLIREAEEVKVLLNRRNRRLRKVTHNIRLNEFELNWSLNKDVFKKFVYKTGVYKKRKYYIRHALQLVERYRSGNPPTPVLEPNLCRMLAFIIAVKVIEDQSTFLTDFLEAFPALTESDEKLSKETLTRREAEFLSAVNWKVSADLQKKKVKNRDRS